MKVSYIGKDLLEKINTEDRLYDIILNNNISLFKEYFNIDYVEFITGFMDVLSFYFTDEQLENARRNLRKLKIKIIEKEELEKNVSYYAFYDSTENSIVINLETINNHNRSLYSVLYHEFLHMASSYSTGQIGLGIDMEDNDKIWGRMLNEGYTEILTHRYFAFDLKESDYKDYVFFALILEKIVGRDKMEYFYMKGDLNGLICEFKDKGLSDDEIIYIIDRLDKSFYSYNKLNVFLNTLKDIFIKTLQLNLSGEDLINEINLFNIEVEEIGKLLYGGDSKVLKKR